MSDTHKPKKNKVLPAQPPRTHVLKDSSHLDYRHANKLTNVGSKSAQSHATAHPTPVQAPGQRCLPADTFGMPSSRTGTPSLPMDKAMHLDIQGIQELDGNELDKEMEVGDAGGTSGKSRSDSVSGNSNAEDEMEEDVGRDAVEEGEDMGMGGAEVTEDWTPTPQGRKSWS